MIGLTAVSVEAAKVEPDTLEATFSQQLDEVVVKSASRRKLSTATNTELITSAELRRAACCNLGESFTTNPSVDVAYSDAATGARQIRLLGLAGSYVQMLQENIPALRIDAAPYGLGYVPGPWMQSIQVSKGAASVKNGYESVSGQINVESRKPQTEERLDLNGYFDTEQKGEINATGNLHLGRNWSGALLLHGEKTFKTHDENGDGFADMPDVGQWSAFNRWAYMGENYVMQVGAKFLGERRKSGQIGHLHNAHPGDYAPYVIQIDTKRVEAFTKNAYIFDHKNDGNVALIVSGVFHDRKSAYGVKDYDVVQKELYSQLMFERKWSDLHSLSTGISFSYDHLRQHLFLPEAGMPTRLAADCEALSGAYAQYTLNLQNKFIAMAGLRYDFSSIYHSLLTPRLHLRWMPSEPWSFNASAGMGRHTPHPYSEYSYLLASSRRLIVAQPLRQEKAYNFGVSGSWRKNLWGRDFSVVAEYYYTRFSHCLTLNLDYDPHAAILSTSGRGAKGNAVQAEITGQVLKDLELTAAWRLNDVKMDFGDGRYVSRPLQSASRWLFTAAFTPMMGLWQFDVSFAVNSGGKMPTPALSESGKPLWESRYHSFGRLNAQITRNYRHWSLYLGGENLTGYRQKHPIIGADNPWGPDFDATMVYAPLHGAFVYVGFRYNLK